MESPNENHNDIFTVHAGNLFHNKILWLFDCTWRLSIIVNGSCNLNNCLYQCCFCKTCNEYKENGGAETQ